MKLRIKGNTIRLRLSRQEVDILSKEGFVKEETNFENSSFIYLLKKEDRDTLKADFNNNQFTISIPKKFVSGWPVNDVVGIDNMEIDGTMPALYILVEKDFKCIDNTMEDQSDNYENPKTC